MSTKITIEDYGGYTIIHLDTVSYVYINEDFFAGFKRLWEDTERTMFEGALRQNDAF